MYLSQKNLVDKVWIQNQLKSNWQFVTKTELDEKLK